MRWGLMADVETTAAALYYSYATESFAIEAYARQVLKNPLHKPFFAPFMFPSKIIKLAELNAIYSDIIGVTGTEIRHRAAFRNALAELNADRKPLPLLEIPDEVNSVTEPVETAPAGFKTIWENLVFDLQQEERATKLYSHFATVSIEGTQELFRQTAVQEAFHYKIFDNLLKGILAGMPVKVKCPVCGQTLEFIPEEGKKIGCPVCAKGFQVKIVDGDFTLVSL